MITAEQQLNEMNEERIKQRYELMAPFLDEKQRRLLAGAEAIAYGAGGQERIAELLDMAHSTVRRGMRDAMQPETVETRRVRRVGGGRKHATDQDTELRSTAPRYSGWVPREPLPYEGGFVTHLQEV